MDIDGSNLLAPVGAGMADPGSIVIRNYRERWFFEFLAIRDQLASDLNDGLAPFTHIEHIGSTSVQGLAAKDIIDILITIDPKHFNDAYLSMYKDALASGRCQQGYQFRGNTGIEGRWTFKLEGVVPGRNVYIAPRGGDYEDSVLSLRDTLIKHKDLREEYSRIKRELAATKEPWNYGTAKNDIIRKILRRAGWEDWEIDAKEARVRPREPPTAQYPEE